MVKRCSEIYGSLLQRARETGFITQHMRNWLESVKIQTMSLGNDQPCRCWSSEGMLHPSQTSLNIKIRGRSPLKEVLTIQSKGPQPTTAPWAVQNQAAEVAGKRTHACIPTCSSSRWMHVCALHLREWHLCMPAARANGGARTCKLFAWNHPFSPPLNQSTKPEKLGNSDSKYAYQGTKQRNFS